jgi:hypothetical protein
VNPDSERVSAIPVEKPTNCVVSVEFAKFSDAFRQSKGLHRVIGYVACGSKPVNHFAQDAVRTLYVLSAHAFDGHAQRITDSNTYKATLEALQPFNAHTFTPPNLCRFSFGYFNACHEL